MKNKPDNQPVESYPCSNNMGNNPIPHIYSLLEHRYGDAHWWPADSPFEVIVGAILTQNTAWTNVMKALDNFDGQLSPQFIEQVSLEELAEIIKPSGFFTQKSRYLKNFITWFKQYGYSFEMVADLDTESLRNGLLAIKGIGQETADSMLVYAFMKPSFVVDAYTKRLLTRAQVLHEPDYMGIKRLFERSLPLDLPLFNNYHALIVINAKEHCKAKPNCEGCPLACV